MEAGQINRIQFQGTRAGIFYLRLVLKLENDISDYLFWRQKLTPSVFELVK